jgi:hypothetical protein
LLLRHRKPVVLKRKEIAVDGFADVRNSSLASLAL